MLVDRNRMSHTYDSSTFDTIIKAIEETYLDRLGRIACSAEPGDG